jgi:hypothetical protein
MIAFIEVVQDLLENVRDNLDCSRRDRTVTVYHGWTRTNCDDGVSVMRKMYEESRRLEMGLHVILRITREEPLHSGRDDPSWFYTDLHAVAMGGRLNLS